MDETLLEVREHRGRGYKPLVDFGAWRVAILRAPDGAAPSPERSMERHLKTDEVFVLTAGEGLLVIGGNGSQVGALDVQPMEIGKVYNIKRSVWHTVILSGEASVVIVENQDTDTHNSEYWDLNGAQKQTILKLVRDRYPDLSPQS